MQDPHGLTRTVVDRNARTDEVIAGFQELDPEACGLASLPTLKALENRAASRHKLQACQLLKSKDQATGLHRSG
jgi:hypothetical protein